MSSLTASLAVCLIALLPISFCKGETIDVINKITLSADKTVFTGERNPRYNRLYVYSVFLDGDTAFVATNAGILMSDSSGQSWKRIIELGTVGNNWWGDFKRAKKDNILFSTEYLWKIKGQEDIIVFDDYIGYFYTIDYQNEGVSKTKLWGRIDKKSSINRVRIYNNYIFYSLYPEYHNYMLAVSHTDKSDYHRIFQCPSQLKHFLDSVWTYPDCTPAFNPVDTTIWLAINHYNYIYIADMNGNLLDSVKIAADNYRLPQPPVSHVKSDAVFQDWLSKCTPIESFWYISPGYFVLQYRSGWRRLRPDSICNYSTLVWGANRQPVKLAVDKSWKAVGVQEDGRIVFWHYLIENNIAKKVMLSIARIEP